MDNKQERYSLEQAIAETKQEIEAAQAAGDHVEATYWQRILMRPLHKQCIINILRKKQKDAAARAAREEENDAYWTGVCEGLDYTIETLLFAE